MPKEVPQEDAPRGDSGTDWQDSIEHDNVHNVNMFSNLLQSDVNIPTFDTPTLVKGKYLSIYYSNLDTMSNKKEEIIGGATGSI